MTSLQSLFLFFIFYFLSYLSIRISLFSSLFFTSSSLLLASSVAWGEERFLFAGFAGSGPSDGGLRAISTCRLNWSALSPCSCSLWTQVVCRQGQKEAQRTLRCTHEAEDAKAVRWWVERAAA